MTEDKISVIVPAYNVEKYIEKCLDSLLLQTHYNIEIIIVDDGSADGTYAICSQYEKAHSRIQLWHKENGGLASARNFGLEKAEGAYIGFVDSDDYLEPDMYEVLLNHLMEHDASMAVCDLVYEEAGHPAIVDNQTYGEVTVYNNEQLLLMFLQGKGLTSVCNKLFKREITTHLFPLIYNSEDAAYLLDIFIHPCTAVSADQKLYHYVQHNGSMRVRKFNPEHLDALNCAEMVVNKIREVYPQFLPYALAFQFKYCIGTLARIYVWDVEKEYQDAVAALKLKITEIYRNPQKRLMAKSKRLAWLCYCVNKLVFRLIMKVYYGSTLYKVIKNDS